MNVNKIIALLGVGAILASCTIKLDNYVQKNSETFLTIQGGISDQAEQQSIQLYMSYTRADYSGLSTPVKGAKVYVIDEKGVKFDYLETNQVGLYKTAEKKGGHAGGTYTFHLEFNGKIYESTPEPLPFCPDIDKSYYEATVKDNFPIGSPNRGGFDVYVDLKDPTEQGNYYRWTWRHYDPLTTCARCEGAGWNDKTNLCTPLTGVYTNPLTPIPFWRIPCRSQCYDIKYSQDVHILSDNLINGQPISRVLITRVPYVLDENYIPVHHYYLRVEQRSISKHSYEAFKQQKNSDNSGTLFDVPALTATNLNVTCINDPNQRIIGIFEVYGIKYKIINVNLDDNIPNVERLLYFPPVTDEPCPKPQDPSCSAPCLESLYRTNNTPEGWIFQ